MMEESDYIFGMTDVDDILADDIFLDENEDCGFSPLTNNMYSRESDYQYYVDNNRCVKIVDSANNLTFYVIDGIIDRVYDSNAGCDILENEFSKNLFIYDDGSWKTVSYKGRTLYGMWNDGNLTLLPKNGLSITFYNAQSSIKNADFYTSTFYNNVEICEKNGEVFYIADDDIVNQIKISDGKILKYYNGNQYYSRDSENIISLNDNYTSRNFILYPYGGLYSDGKWGTWKTDGDYYILQYEDGTCEKLNSYSNVVETINADGTRIQYNTNLRQAIKFRNDNSISYYNINCINYDEEKYREIILNLNKLVDSRSSIDSNFSNISNIVSTACDQLDNADDIKNDLYSAYDKVNSLASKINYSCLVYNGFDADLKKYLDGLVDDIFSSEKTDYENKFMDVIGDYIEKDVNGLYDYKDIDFTKIDSEMYDVIFDTQIVPENGFERLTVSEAKNRYGELGFDYHDEDSIVAVSSNSVGCIPCIFVFDKNNINPLQLLNVGNKVIEYTNSNYNSSECDKKIINKLGENNYHFVLDQKNDPSGAAMCSAGANLINIHCIEYYGDGGDYTVKTLGHEMGHAVDYSLFENSDYINYNTLIDEAYNNNRPMFIMPIDPWNSSYNDSYIKINYDTAGLPYIIHGSDKIMLNDDFTISFDGVDYHMVSANDAKCHCGEVAAEVYRYYSFNPGELLCRTSNDDSYYFIMDNEFSYLKNEFGADDTWYTDWKNEG